MLCKSDVRSAPNHKIYPTEENFGGPIIEFALPLTGRQMSLSDGSDQHEEAVADGRHYSLQLFILAMRIQEDLQEPAKGAAVLGSLRLCTTSVISTWKCCGF